LQSNLRKGQSPFYDVQVAHLLAVGLGEGATSPPQYQNLKRKTGNALPVFLYNCATRNQRAILPTAIARQCPSYKNKKALTLRKFVVVF
jgi:hypothetical protein